MDITKLVEKREPFVADRILHIVHPVEFQSPQSEDRLRMDESSFAFDRSGHLVVRPTCRPHSDQHPCPFCDSMMVYVLHKELRRQAIRGRGFLKVIDRKRRLP
jgi:hypothetical protein